MIFFSNDDVKFCIGMTTFNRSDYLERSLTTLKKVNYLPETKFVFVDDCSTDTKVNDLILDFVKEKSDTVQSFYFKNSTNIGSLENYLNLLNRMKEIESDFYVIIDSDCIFNCNWLYELKRMILLQNDRNKCIYTSWYMPQNKNQSYYNILEEHDSFNVCLTANGTGMVLPKCLMKYFHEELDREVYNKRHFDGYISWYLVKKLDLRIIGPKASYMDHIGIVGVNSSTIEYCDTAYNFLGAE